MNINDKIKEAKELIARANELLEEVKNENSNENDNSKTEDNPKLPSLIPSKWMDVFSNEDVPPLKNAIIESIKAATKCGYTISEIDHALHWQVEDALYEYDFLSSN